MLPRYSFLYELHYNEKLLHGPNFLFTDNSHDLIDMNNCVVLDFVRQLPSYCINFAEAAPVASFSIISNC